MITRDLFDAAKRKREDRWQQIGINTYRMGQGATSMYLLTGLIHCSHCGHSWQGYSTTKGRRRKDGTSVKNYYYACSGYVTKGNHVCERSVIYQDAIEGWVLQQIEQIIQRFLEAGGDTMLQSMIRQQVEMTVTCTETVNPVSLDGKQEISRLVLTALSNISEDNRDFVNAHLEQPRLEAEE